VRKEHGPYLPGFQTVLDVVAMWWQSQSSIQTMCEKESSLLFHSDDARARPVELLMGRKAMALVLLERGVLVRESSAAGRGVERLGRPNARARGP
jgi:hypothetical protein